MKKYLLAICIAAISTAMLCSGSRSMAQSPVLDSQTQDNKPTTNAEYEERWKEAHRHYEEGLAQQKKKNYAAAIAAFQKALPYDVSAYENLGDAYTTTGEYGKALDAYHTVVYPVGYGSSRTNDTDARMKYALALHRVGRFDEALFEYQKGLENLHDNFLGVDVTMEVNRQNMATKQLVAGAHLALAVYALKSNDDEAVRQCAEVLRLKPGYGGTYLCLAEALRHASPPLGMQFGERPDRVALHKAIDLSVGPVRKAAQAILESRMGPGDRPLRPTDTLIIPSASELDIEPSPPHHSPIPDALLVKPKKTAQ